MIPVRELASLVRWNKPPTNLIQYRLDHALTVWDLRRLAQRRTPKAAFDYTDGAAEDEISIRRARQAFRDIEFHPAILRDVTQVCLQREILGQVSELPFGIAPTGFTRLMHTQGEIAGAQAAWHAGIPFSLSTLATTSIEEVSRVAPGGRHWFQLYMWKDRQRSMALLERAWHAGYDTVLVTVDCPVSGARLRDNRNGLSIPPALTVRTVLNTIPKVSWWVNFLTTEPLRFASLNQWPGTVSDYIDSMFDASLTFEDLAWIQHQWPGKFVVKGIQTLSDARRLAQMGVDGIVLSNHGGRQLDRAPVPFHLLPQVAREIGQDVEIIVDTGIMSGADIIACIALGAHFTLIGRAYLYGLMAGGQAGVNRLITILTTQMRRTMQLLGVARLEELTPEHVSQYLPPTAPR